MNIFLLIAGILLLALSVYLIVRPHFPSVIASYGGLWALLLGDWLDVPMRMLTYWGAMVVVVLIITSMQQRTLVKATQGMVHICLGALTGMALGAVGGYALMVVGAAVGATLGAVVFARTPGGSGLDFPSQRFLQYLCAKGLPAVISVSIIGIAILIAAVEYE